MTLVQIQQIKGRVDRVPRGDVPVIELDLEPNQRVVYVSLSESLFDPRDRKTVDWHWIAYVENRIGS